MKIERMGWLSPSAVARGLCTCCRRRSNRCCARCAVPLVRTLAVKPYVPRVAGISESRSTRPGTAVAPTYQRPTPAPSRATAVSRPARLAAPLARQSRESACTLHRSSRLSAMGFFKKSEVKKNYEFGKGRSSNPSPSPSPSHHPHPNHDRQGPRQRQLRRGQIGHQDLGQ